MATGAIFTAVDVAGLVTQLSVWSTNMEGAVAELHGGQARMEMQVAGLAQAFVSEFDRVINDFRLELTI